MEDQEEEKKTTDNEHGFDMSYTADFLSQQDIDELWEFPQETEFVPKIGPNPYNPTTTSIPPTCIRGGLI